MRIFLSLLILAFPAIRAVPSGGGTDINIQVSKGVSEGPWGKVLYFNCKVFNPNHCFLRYNQGNLTYM